MHTHTRTQCLPFGRWQKKFKTKHFAEAAKMREGKKSIFNDVFVVTCERVPCSSALTRCHRCISHDMRPHCDCTSSYAVVVSASSSNDDCVCADEWAPERKTVIYRPLLGLPLLSIETCTNALAHSLADVSHRWLAYSRLLIDFTAYYHRWTWETYSRCLTNGFVRIRIIASRVKDFRKIIENLCCFEANNHVIGTVGTFRPNTSKHTRQCRQKVRKFKWKWRIQLTWKLKFSQFMNHEPHTTTFCWCHLTRCLGALTISVVSTNILAVSTGYFGYLLGYLRFTYPTIINTGLGTSLASPPEIVEDVPKHFSIGHWTDSAAIIRSVQALWMDITSSAGQLKFIEVILRFSRAWTQLTQP